MKTRFLLVPGGLALAAASLLAHHSMTAVYNDATPVTIIGEFSLKHRNFLASGLITGLG